MKDFYLIRHGQSRANAGFPAVSNDKEALTDLGKKQAKLTAAHLTKTPDLIVTSTYLRTHQTSAPTKERFPDAKHEIWPIEEFHQLNPLTEHGLTIEKMIPLFNHHWGRYNPHHSNGGGAESWADILGRVDAFENHLKNTSANLIYAFSHGFFIKTFLVKHALGNTELAMNMEGLDHLMNGVFWVGNCAITHGIVTDDGEILVGRYSNHHIPEPMRT
ncbi:MAG: putative phosphoglycerate mutase [Cellvibrionaceae bacterium]|jgi:probable phosphoglycerate mutase